MAYFNNGYVGYPNVYQPVPDQLQQLRSQPQQQMQMPQQDDRIFVQGKLAAQAYLVAPNNFVRLWDSLENVFYEKRADASGRPFMKDFEYHERIPKQENITEEKKIDYEEKIKALIQRAESLEQRIKALESMKGVPYEYESISDDTTIQSI